MKMPTTKRRSQAHLAVPAARERYVLVRQGEGPNRRWVWQLAAPARRIAPGPRAPARS